jgi:hypothetical protein
VRGGILRRVLREGVAEGVAGKDRQHTREAQRGKSVVVAIVLGRGRWSVLASGCGGRAPNTDAHTGEEKEEADVLNGVARRATTA